MCRNQLAVESFRSIENLANTSLNDDLIKLWLRWQDFKQHFVCSLSHQFGQTFKRHFQIATVRLPSHPTKP